MSSEGPPITIRTGPSTKSFDLRAVPRNLKLAEATPKERERLFFGKDFDVFILQHTRDRSLVERLRPEDISTCDVRRWMFHSDHRVARMEGEVRTLKAALEVTIINK